MGADGRCTRLAVALQSVGAAAPEDSAARILEDLERHYGEPHRAHHNLAHIDSCLAWLDWFRAEAGQPAEVELALWFHDAVYDPMRRDNEARSADLATCWLSLAEVSRESVARVAELITATRDHTASRGDAALVCSIDLAILGSDVETYAAYEGAVREEYAQVPDAAYQVGRRAFLQAMLKRSMIFTVPALRDELEVKARSNLRWSLERLDCGRRREA